MTTLHKYITKYLQEHTYRTGRNLNIQAFSLVDRSPTPFSPFESHCDNILIYFCLHSFGTHLLANSCISKATEKEKGHDNIQPIRGRNSATSTQRKYPLCIALALVNSQQGEGKGQKVQIDDNDFPLFVHRPFGKSRSTQLTSQHRQIIAIAVSSSLWRVQPPSEPLHTVRGDALAVERG